MKLSAVKTKSRTNTRPKLWADQHDDGGAEYFTRDEIQELRKQIKDSHDPVRYMIKNDLTEAVGMAFFYNVSEDVWTTGQAEGTLFKRLPAAQAILKLLGGDALIITVKVKNGKVASARAAALALA